MPEVIKTILTADSSELRSEFSRASSAVAAYQAKQQAGFSRAISAHQSEISALKLQKDGFTNLAASLRETTSLKQQAISFAAAANISEEKALSLLREKQSLQQQITAGVAQEAAARAAAATREAAVANPRATGLPGGGGLAPLTPQSLQAMDRQIASTRELRRQTLLAGQSGKNGALGFLAFSQAVEDAQYGIKGVLNNIPQMILGFGGTAGLAGAISLAAVAATILYPQLKKLYGAADNEKIKKAAAEWDRVFQEGNKAALAFEKSVNLERELLALSSKTTLELRSRLDILNQMSKYYDEELTNARARRDTEGEILAARLKLAEASGTGVPAAQAAIDTAGTVGLEADMINRQKELARIQDEVSRKNEVTANLREELAAREIADTTRLIELKKQLAGSQANQAAVVEAGKDVSVKEFLALSPDRRAIGNRMRAIQSEIQAIENKGKTIKEVYAAEIQNAVDAIKALDAKANLTKQETEELQRQIAVRRELLQIQSDTAQQENITKFQAQMDREAAAAFEERQKAQADAISKWQAQMDSEKSTGGARADYQAELIAMRLQLAGRKTLADQMREETALRKEALTIAAAQGISEQEALALATERAQLIKDISAQEEKAALRAQKHPNWKPRSEYRGIRRAENAAGDFNSGNNLQDWSSNWRLGGPTRSNGRPIKSAEGSLKQDSLRRRRQEREADALRNSSDPNVRIGQRSLDVQEQLLEGLKRIGVLK